MIHVISAKSLDTIREIALNIRHGSKGKISLVFSYVSNQIWQKFLIILGGLILVVPLYFQYDAEILYDPKHKSK